MKSLIIVESPAKAKTIKNFLGPDYDVIASKGHIRDLPKSTFGIKIEGENFTPEYKISADHSAIVKEIKELAKNADQIYLATNEIGLPVDLDVPVSALAARPDLQAAEARFAAAFYDL